MSEIEILLPQEEQMSFFEHQITVSDSHSERSTPILTGEFWTNRQRQANALHEIAYRACFKAQLPNYFIQKFTNLGDWVYDPFSGRGTTALEAALLGRNVIANDINPISQILLEGRMVAPSLSAIESRLCDVNLQSDIDSEIDLSMFYHPETYKEIIGWKRYFLAKQENDGLDDIDKWIRAVATNRLTGHSPGYFSVYTLPPNQAVSAERQKRINEKRAQVPPYRETRALILKKSISLQKGLTSELRSNLQKVKKRFLTGDARESFTIPDASIKLVVTSPPFLDIVQYAADNWLRCWFNGIDASEIATRISTVRKLEDWQLIMTNVFSELFRITVEGGFVAFEVGEVRNGTVTLEDSVLPIGTKIGFTPIGIMVNTQSFTKTANIWGVKNNSKGTNSNRIVVFRKD